MSDDIDINPLACPWCHRPMVERKTMTRDEAIEFARVWIGRQRQNESGKIDEDRMDAFHRDLGLLVDFITDYVAAQEKDGEK